MSDWIVANTRLRKKPFSFEGYEFQKQIVDDMHPSLCVIKCSQIGLTEIQLRKFAGFLARNTGVRAIFSLPYDFMFKRVSQTRFGPMIASDHVFNVGVEKPVRSIGLYQIGQSFGYFTGGKEADATSIDADALFQDEIDLADPEMLALYQSRLQGSKYRITQSFSTPTFEGYGIDAQFQGSDQHVYLCRCTRCNHYNLPDFTLDFVTIPGLSSDINDLTEIDADIVASMDLGASYLRCEKCGARLDVGDPGLREWVPRYPGRRTRGYAISPFSTPHLTVERVVDSLIKYKQRDALRRFFNTVLGKPYNDSKARLSEREIRAVMKGEAVPEIGPDVPVVLGCDMGLTCHLVLMHLGHEHPVVFDWRQVPADRIVAEIRQILNTYNVVGGCIDRNPYTPTSNEIRDMSETRIVPVQYATSLMAAPVQIVKDELDNLSHITANRTDMIDAVVSAIRKYQIEFVGYKRQDRLIIDHLTDMVRVEKEDKPDKTDPNQDMNKPWSPPAAWRKLTGNDHYFHALAYAVYSLKATKALEYRSDADPRTLCLVSSLTVPMIQSSDLGVKSRRKMSISLGHMI